MKVERFTPIEYEDLILPQGYSVSEESLFLFTEEENNFRSEVRSFMDQEIVPMTEQFEKDNVFPRKALQLIAKKGYVSYPFPKEWGGLNEGNGITKDFIVSEELAAVSPVTSTARIATMLSCIPICRFGSYHQKEKFLKPVLSGKKIGAIVITEPQAGSDTARMQTIAIRDQNHYVLNGEKRFITNAGEAEVNTTFAITDRSVHPHKGMSCFVVEKDMQGFEVVEHYNLLGMRGARNGHLRFKNMRVPVENLVGRENEGFPILLDELDIERTVIAGEAIGHARRAYEIALEYSLLRVQFHQPISNFEAVSFKLAEMHTKIEASRLLALKAARLIDVGKPASKESAEAKMFATNMSVEVCNEALQIVGGIGYTTKFPMEQYYRDARMMKIAGGTTEILTYLIARELISDAKKKRKEIGQTEPF
ncbi:MAG: acyl-CoA dehydrogenase family protein [Candidatus Jordarchaeum sp.]|uniref:acyl-CoA dehydrogenase family protein n=1 Tax=Candidatus Jordarchaeum sp. TaxID=2823881 RepID=UPI0040491381